MQNRRTTDGHRIGQKTEENKNNEDRNRKREKTKRGGKDRNKGRKVREREERFTVTLVLLYLHAQPTYTGQSTEQPDTHFRHLRLDALGDQCFHSTLCRHW